ncbi:hypothetical protein DRE_04475 [Drechslerella stenobrocha 248]|uniref:Cytochrome P450 n=1 Tax=Drechslerella stenobrocha 248 TaxID=1043628 RepID=W7HSS1_9PEZI|nr:hypothetical protein DRE_04475 [Drechslerella stenobrocha 248]
MVSTVSLVVLSLLAYYVLSSSYGLWKNVQKAKASGLPYVVLPVHIFNPFWIVFGRIVIGQVVKYFPDAWITRNYLFLLMPEWSWRYGYSPFEKHGDVFLSVMPASCNIWIADREVISQVSSRRDDFPKPGWMYRTINLFGRNVVTTEGSEWKFHRKVTSPSFGEKNNALVFEESIRQTRQMLRKWTGDSGAGGITVRNVLEDTMRLSLHVISGAGFGVTLQWPGTSKDADRISAVGDGSAHQHTLSFKDALAGLLHNVIFVLAFPKWLLKILPFKRARDAAEAALEYENYMNELFAEKKREAIAGEKAEGMDIMGALVKNSYGPENRVNRATTQGDAERQALTDSEILGNAFVFLLAGHETSAGALHYTMLLLALHPDSQRELQSDIDKIFGDRPIDEWDYNKDIAAMQNSMIGAVMFEEMRLIPPVTNVPKQVSIRDQVMIVNGKKTVWPEGSTVSLCGHSIHRNPKYWPSTGPSTVTDDDHDLEDFVPRRWLLNKGAAADGSVADGEELSNGAAANKLYHPLKGSYLPFSEGARSCLGKRFAQVEIMIMIAMVFKHYSVELAVDESADDDTVEKMSSAERIELYDKQRVKARTIIRDFSSVMITVQIRGNDVPIRLVPRGKERFIHLFKH